MVCIQLKSTTRATVSETKSDEDGDYVEILLENIYWDVPGGCSDITITASTEQLASLVDDLGSGVPA